MLNRMLNGWAFIFVVVAVLTQINLFNFSIIKKEERAPLNEFKCLALSIVCHENGENVRGVTYLISSRFIIH